MGDGRGRPFYGMGAGELWALLGNEGFDFGGLAFFESVGPSLGGEEDEVTALALGALRIELANLDVPDEVLGFLEIGPRDLFFEQAVEDGVGREGGGQTADDVGLGQGIWRKFR